MSKNSVPAAKSASKEVSERTAMLVSYGIVVLCGVWALFSPPLTMRTLIIVAAYFCVVLAASLVRGNGKATKILRRIAYAPAQLLLKLWQLLPSLYIILLAYLLVSGVVILVLVWLPELICGVKLSIPAIVYILLSAASIIMTTVGDRIIWYIRGLVSKRVHKDVAITGLDQKKIRYLVLMIYFCAIVVFTLASLTGNSIFEMEQLDYSIIQSFATYIAYDRLVRNYKTVAGSKRM